MNATNKTALGSAFVVVLVFFLLFGGGAMTGATLSGAKDQVICFCAMHSKTGENNGN